MPISKSQSRQMILEKSDLTEFPKEIREDVVSILHKALNKQQFEDAVWDRALRTEPSNG